MTDSFQVLSYFAILMMVLGAFHGIIFGAWLLIKVKKFIKNSLKARAVVTDYKLITKGKDSYNEVTFEFKNNKGESFVTKSHAMKKYKKNDRIEILYSKSDPHDTRINSFQVLYLLPFIFIVVMPIMTLLLFVLLNSNGYLD